MRGKRDSLVCHKNLERRDKVGEGDARVLEPLLVFLGVVDENEEVVVLALVMDLGLDGLSTGHDD